jgi:hypothetical protein
MNSFIRAHCPKSILLTYDDQAQINWNPTVGALSS